MKKKNILIVAATKQEVKVFFQYLKKHFVIKKIKPNFYTANTKSYHIHILITGASMVNTAYYLGQLSSQTFDYVINAGICGAYDKRINIGDVVIVTEDIFSEFGAEDGSNFLRASEIDLGNEKIIPKKLFIPSVFSHLKKVRSITVNKVHGNNYNIQKVKKLFHPQTESMEGAAFYFACNQNQWKCLQIRAVSNYVEKRDKNKWNIPLAINNLNYYLIQYIQSL